LVDSTLLVGAASRVTCADCPVLTVNPRASRPLADTAPANLFCYWPRL
jgi:hypothetical protein